MDAQWMSAFHDMGNMERRIDAVIHGWGYAIHGAGYSTKDALSRPWLSLRWPPILYKNFLNHTWRHPFSLGGLRSKCRNATAVANTDHPVNQHQVYLWNPSEQWCSNSSRCPQKVPVLVQPPYAIFRGPDTSRRRCLRDRELSKLTYRALTWQGVEFCVCWFVRRYVSLHEINWLRWLAELFIYY